ncbi:TPR repeat-containing thioredoxin TTL2 [Dendrobium catenatum]|uniref:TPR repeat-containing thioredoxin TTL2 n=1 Tax=Dendrobium catenatum TaxID=906689 RepID=A0A2I0X8V7_9ASPA|nr:TPR repeat-containing thioredoxin TTL2 [Dendrobium catenatum]
MAGNRKISLAQMAARIDPGSREIAAIARKAQSVASARSMGNDLCNRAACRSKLGQWETTIEVCNDVLNLRPKYSKARLRRLVLLTRLDDHVWLGG